MTRETMWPRGVTRIRYDFDADFFVACERRGGQWTVWDEDVRQGAREVASYASRADALQKALGFVAARKLSDPSVSGARR